MHYQSPILISQIVATLKRENLKFSEKNISEDFVCSGIATNSKLVEKDSVFICMKGFSVDGHDFAQKTLDKGVKLLIVERFLDLDVAQIKVDYMRKTIAVLAKIFFDNPSSKFKLLGITGTNGKTTTSFFTYNLLRKLGKNVGLIGTLGHWINDEYHKSERTTPDIIELNEIFARMINENVEIVVMEVSSHAVALDRIFGLEFDSGIFTNLTRDHLDFHKTFEEYSQCKYSFLEQVNNNNGSIYLNTDDKYGFQFHSKLSRSISVSFEEANVKINSTKMSKTHTSIELDFKGEIISFISPFLGFFNVKNLVFAISLCKECDFDLKNIIENVENLEQVPGRLELVKIDGMNTIIDYAHTPDALKNVIVTLKNITSGRIITVVGAGGDRDSGKRPEMGIIASENSDIVIFTSDNPRSENPKRIIKDLISEAENNIIVIENRKFAIHKAMDFCRDDDIVLIAGKGHEDYQEIQGGKFHFSDKETVLSYKKEDNYEENLGNGSQQLAIEIDSLILNKLFDNQIDIERSFSSISTDSRTIKENSIFIALKGDNFDGHRFIEEILKDETNVVIISDSTYMKKNRTILVENTLDAYHKIAKYYLDLFKVNKVGITGSYGKTTTKEIMFNILSEDGKTLKTYGNENNFIGTPRTIFKLNPFHKHVIFELGTNMFGEIEKLTNLVRPEISLITAVAPAHLKGFTTIKNIMNEKSHIFDFAKFKIFSKDSEILSSLNGISIGFSEENMKKISDVRKNSGIHFNFAGEKFIINSKIDFHALNAAFSIEVAKILKIDCRKIQLGLQKELDLGNRMKIQSSKGKTIIFDCYNANPESMKYALAFWAELRNTQPHVAIIGDMLELGTQESFYHSVIAEKLNEISTMKTISVGELSKLYNCDVHFSTVESLLDSMILEELPANAVILIKASNSIKLSKLIGRF